MIKDENYYVVQGWMATQLGLKGTKRDVYAIIYGFTQNNETEFSGSLSYLQEWCNVSRVTIIKCLQELVDEGLIVKTEEYKNNVKFCRYKATLQVVKKFNYPSKETLQGGSKETLHNNTKYDNKKENNIIAERVLTYLNEKAGTHFRPIESNLKFINARLKDYTEEELKSVINKKVDEWKGGKMQMYLRPETLFNATKFETYLNGLEKVNKPEWSNFSTRRNYTREEMNSLFQSVDEIEI